jgi:hypothetical protein
MEKDILWTMGDFTQINIKDMSTIHILRTLSCLRGIGKTHIPEGWGYKSKIEWIDIFENELKLRKKQ